MRRFSKISRFQAGALASAAAALSFAACGNNPDVVAYATPPSTPPRTDAGALATYDAGDGGACTYCGGACVDIATDPNNCGGCGHTCSTMTLPEHATPTCAQSACTFKCHDGYAPAPDGTCVRSIAAPRPLSPLPTEHVATARPTLRWLLPPATDGASVEICPTRACDSGVVTLEADGEILTLPNDLTPGVHFWRLRGRAAKKIGTVVSATWELFVPHARDAAQGTDGGDDGGTNATPGLLGAHGGVVADFNGDGFADLAVADTGHIYIYYGGAGGMSDAARATIDAPATGQLVLAIAGDVNGAGFADLVIGAPDAGKVFVYSGGLAGIPTTFAYQLSAPKARDGSIASGFGAAIAAAGDVNGDGYADVVVGACGSNVAYVYSGGPGGLADIHRTDLLGPSPGDVGFGCAVAGARDIDGDGYHDVVIGAPKTGGGTGAVHVYFGSPAELSRAPALSLAGPQLSGAAFGQAVALGDANGDGYADILVGAPGSNAATGRAYIFTGSASTMGPDAAAVYDGPFGRGSGFGTMVAGVADVDGDGIDDFVISSPTMSPSNPVGRVHFFRGLNGALPTAPAATLSGPDGGSFGAAFTCGDVDGDGLTDLIVGAAGTPARAYLFRGASPSPSAAPTHFFIPPTGSTTFGKTLAMMTGHNGARCARKAGS